MAIRFDSFHFSLFLIDRTKEVRMTSLSRSLTAAILMLLASSTTGFAVTVGRRTAAGSTSTSTALYMTHDDMDAPSTTSTTSATSTPTKAALLLAVPLQWDEMVRQAATAMKQAAAAGQTRQMVRILLPRDRAANDLGQAVEELVSDDTLSESVLTPPDESWQGGIMQLYRAALPTATAILRRLAVSDASLPAAVVEDRSVDESGVDGVGLLQTSTSSTTSSTTSSSTSSSTSSTSSTKVQCWLQPTQENVDAICDRTQQADKESVVVLMNPQWRMVDDALDTASQGTGFLSTVASFLGGKGGNLKKLSAAGFLPVYSLEGYVCRGTNVRLLQVYGSDWTVFCERDNGESFLYVGTCVTRPTYQQVEALLNESDIGFKYARDIGFEPKL